MTENSRHNKTRSARKRSRQANNKKQLASLEKLEPKQMLTADPLDFTITLESQGTTYPADSSYSYSAPWNWTVNNDGKTRIQGKYEQSSWTAEQSGHANEITMDTNGVIKTVEDFYGHLAAGTVAEVSDLVGCFYFTPLDANKKPTGGPSSLYSPQIEEAWVSSSDNLYSLLVLNQRFPASAGNSNGIEVGQRGGNGGLYGGTQESNTHGELGANGQKAITISDKALQGMARIVGFASGGIPQLISSPSEYVPQLAVFNRLHGPFEPADPHHGGSFSSDEGYVPTLRTFFTQTNQNRPSNIPPLPVDVLEYLENKYSEGFSQNRNPVEIFSELSGISSLGALLAAGQYPQVADPPPPSLPIQQYGNPPVYDAYFNPPALEYRTANYDTYQQACADVGGYYLQSGIPNETAIQNFFSKFAYLKLTELTQIDPISSPAAHESKVTELAVGLRALMAMSYDAAPLWTSYGVGYSNAANPMVGNTDNSQPLRPQLSTQTFLEGFSGQEFQIHNIQLPKNFINISGEPSPGGENYPTYGWYQLDADQNLPAGNNPLTPPSTNYFRSQYSISQAGTAAHMPSDSTSSDTLSAAGLGTAQENEMFTRESTITVDGVTKTFGELDGLIHDEVVLSNTFATYISLGGGVDVVTGSSFNDVIVGPGHGKQFDPEFHGRLTVDSGAGNDIVAPGRGGSVVELGTGADLVVFGTNDLFGEATFFDFNYADGDRIIVGDQIESEWYASTPDTLILSDGQGATKILRLAAASDKTWHRDVVVRVNPLDDTPNGLGPTGEFNYLETHQFERNIENMAEHVSLKIQSTDPTNLPLPKEIWVTLADYQYQSISTTGEHVIALSNFPALSDDDGAFRHTGSFQISITPYDEATKRGFGNRQAEVFVSDSNEVDKFVADKTIVTSTPSTNPHLVPKTKWRYFKEANKSTYAVAYVGGLANVILDTGVNATSDQAPKTRSQGIDIVVDNDFTVGVGTHADNLSSGMVIWGNLNKTDAERIVNTANAAAPGSFEKDLPDNLLSSKSYLVRTLATDLPIQVYGPGRINGINIVSTYNDKTTAKSFPTYWVNSDMLTASSVYQTNDTGPTDWAVSVLGVTVAWPAYRGYGPVVLQDFNKTVFVQEVSGEFVIDYSPVKPKTATTSGDTRALFQNSRTRIYDYKQVGGWVDQADGPAMSGWHSKMTNSFIHANDDSVKAQAAFVSLEHNTVLQGNAGNAVGFAYGFTNGNPYGTTVDSVYAHRIVNKLAGNGYGVVAMRIVPSNLWTYNDRFGENISVSNIYVPAFDKQNVGSMNSVYRASVMEIGNECRTFGPTVVPGTPDYTFQIGGIDASKGWQIQAKHMLAPNNSQIRWSGFATGSKPKVDAHGQWTLNSTPTFNLYGNYPVSPHRRLTNTKVTVTQNTAWGPIKLYQTPTEANVIKRPKLHRSSKIYLNREGEIGPSPVRLVYSDLVRAASYGATAGEESFVVSNVANGSVEKKIGDSWVNVSEAPTSSNPFQLLALLQRRIISPSDEIRWVPSAEDSSKATAEAFSIYGWNSKDKIASDKPSIIDFETV